MSKDRFLNLIPYRPNDYSLGACLLGSEGLIVDAANLSAIFSLYFQWPEYSSCILIQSENADEISIQLECDLEERSLSELRVQFKDQSTNKDSKFKGVIGEKVLIQMSLFRKIYNFKTEILAEKGSKNVSWDLIVQVPGSITFEKQERLPRVKVTDKNRGILPQGFLIKKISQEKFDCKWIELGMSSVRLECLQFGLEQVTHLSVNEIHIPISIESKKGNWYIFNLNFVSAKDVGKFFDIYRLIRFPGLEKRSQFKNDELLKLYQETGYLNKFDSSSSLENFSQECFELWDRLKALEHEVTADYVVVDEEKKPSAASSVVFGFMEGEMPIWVYHQLCAKKNPNLLERSGDLYTWRAEYLASRPEPLKVIVWFDSRSRWLERLYVKAIMTQSSLGQLYAVDVFKITIDQKRTFEVKEFIEWGSQKICRSILKTETILAGVGPDYLNISNLLDSVVYLKDHVDLKMITDSTEKLLNKMNKSEMTLEVTTNNSKISDFLNINGKKVQATDRLAQFNKLDLIDFVSSVEHSIAVTKRKKELGEP